MASHFDRTRVLVAVEFGGEVPDELFENGAVEAAQDAGFVSRSLRLTPEGVEHLYRMRKLFEPA